MPLPMHKKEEKRVSIKNCIGIAAGKGGVGKSSVTVNLALALQQKGFSVGVLDMDIYGPSVRKMLPEDSLPVQRDGFLLPALSRGIKVMSIAYFRKEWEANAVRAPIANGIVGQFIDLVSWGDLDYLLIDFPPGTGDVQLSICQKAHLTGAVMVTTPQEIALLDVRKAMHLFEQVKVPVIGIIENMSYFLHQGEKLALFGEGGGERLSHESGVPFLGQIPIDPLICRAADTGTSLFVHDTPAARIYHEIADALIEQIAGLKGNLVRSIRHNEDHTFTIEWSDGTCTNYHPHTLQKHCPCAGCADGKQTPLDSSVRAVSLTPVGRYALRVTFSSGCSAGIYDFETLRQLAGQYV